MAWYNWACDFGCGTGKGVSDPAVQSALASRFSQLRDSGIHVARWWTFPGNPWQIDSDSSGAPLAVNSAVYADFDAALALAETYDLYYVFVLFSGAKELPAEWLDDPTQRQQLADALRPLFARYRDNPRVLAWEVFNEPDFDVWNGNASKASVVATTQLIVDSIHANSNAYATTSSGFADSLSWYTGIGLDFYQAHWYDYMQPSSSPGGWCVWCYDYSAVAAAHGLDAPLVIGEFYAGADTSPFDRWQGWYDKGYAGAWAWSLFPEKNNDGMTIDLTAAAVFAAAHPDIGPSSN